MPDVGEFSARHIVLFFILLRIMTEFSFMEDLQGATGRYPVDRDYLENTFAIKSSHAYKPQYTSDEREPESPTILYDGCPTAELFFEKLDKEFTEQTELELFTNLETPHVDGAIHGIDWGLCSKEQKTKLDEALHIAVNSKPDFRVSLGMPRLASMRANVPSPRIPVNVSLDEPTHKYTIEGVDAKQNILSVTQLIHMFTGEFDALQIASSNINNLINRGILNACNGNKKKGAQMLAEDYEKRGEVARNRGTHVHALIEYFYNKQIKLYNAMDIAQKIHLPESMACLENVRPSAIKKRKQNTPLYSCDAPPVDTDKSFSVKYCKTKDQLKLLEEYMRKRKEQRFISFLQYNKMVSQYLVPFETEKRMYYDYEGSLKFCGSIDMLYADADGKIILVDWKIIEPKKLEMRHVSRGKGPFTNLTITGLTNYILQLNFYRFVLSQPPYSYNINKTNGMFLVLFSREDFYIVKIPLLCDDFILYLLKFHCSHTNT